MLCSVVICKLLRGNAELDGLALTGLQLNAPESTQTADGLIHGALALVRVDLGHFGAGVISCIPHPEGNLDFAGRTRSGRLNLKMAEFEAGITEPEAERI